MAVRAGRSVGPESERQTGRGAGELHAGISDQRGIDVTQHGGSKQDLGVIEFWVQILSLHLLWPTFNLFSTFQLSIAV